MEQGLWSSVSAFVSSYQPALVAILTVVIAGLQLRISQRQTDISNRQLEMSNRQFEMAQAQAAIERNLARVRIDRFLEPTMEAHVRNISMCYHLQGPSDPHPYGPDGISEWGWDPHGLLEFRDIEVPADLDILAAKAFDRDSAVLVELGLAVSEAAKLGVEFDSDPWLWRDDERQGLEQRDVKKQVDATRVLNRIFHYANACGGFQRHARGRNI